MRVPRALASACIAATIAGAPPARGQSGTAPPPCTPALAGGERIDGRLHSLRWRMQPDRPRVSEFFVLQFAVCRRDGGAAPGEVRVDATMPAHRHGMNYRPSVQRRGDGRFEATGMLLHMPGRWELVFDVRAGPDSETLRATVDLP
jgi:hypothetical protein